MVDIEVAIHSVSHSWYPMPSGTVSPMTHDPNNVRETAWVSPVTRLQRSEMPGLVDLAVLLDDARQEEVVAILAMRTGEK